jgi:hypothetical protein
MVMNRKKRQRILTVMILTIFMAYGFTGVIKGLAAGSQNQNLSEAAKSAGSGLNAENNRFVLSVLDDCSAITILE